MPDYLVTYIDNKGTEQIWWLSRCTDELAARKATMDDPFDPRIKSVVVLNGMVRVDPVTQKFAALEYDHELARQLEMKRDGANAHTTNKALNYYKLFYDRKAWGQMSFLQNEMRKALASGNYRGLGLWMCDWF